jgi:RNA polymerase sigma factor (sigma-70 family)
VNLIEQIKPHAERVAAIWARRFPFYRDEITSAALNSTIEAAMNYEEDKPLDRWASFRARTAILREVRFLKHEERFCPDNAHECDAVDPYDHIAEHDLRDLVEQLLGRLSPTERVVLELMVMKGENSIVVSEKLGLSDKTCRKIRDVALEELRRMTA